MRRTARVLSAAALAGAAVGLPVTAAFADPASEVTPGTAPPGGSVTVSVSCESVGGEAPAAIEATSQAFDEGTVQLRRVAGNDAKAAGVTYRGTARIASAADLEDGGPNAVSPDTVPPGTAPPGTAPPGTAPPGTAPPGTAPPGTAPPDAAAPDAVDPDPAVPDAAVPDAVGPDSVPADSVPGDSVPGDPVPADTAPSDMAPSDTAAPDAVGPDTVSPDTVPPDAVGPDAVAPGTVPPHSVTSDSAWTVNGTCPAGPGKQGAAWSATFKVDLTARGSGPCGERQRTDGCGTAPVQRGVRAGEGGTFTDSVPALAAGGVLIAGALGAAAHRLLRRESTTGR
ncbi:hypothetical protein ACFV29_11030 [Streptomyces sp. NPDC059690]|uniref:hypothetical protein n=1 Tax=Streptomyces sp. NPDC059690 TaxID=3346907 RepID=UPI0036BC2454